MEFLFLGTGPAGGNLKLTGKSRRLESSVLVKTGKGTILIDVTQFFEEQIKRIDRIDAILVTHGHRDACGGVSQLDRWLEKHGEHASLYTLPETIRKIKDFCQPKHIDFIEIQPLRPFSLLDVHITALFVYHSMQPGFPTVGFFIDDGKNSLAYVTDAARWERKTETYMRKADTLILDGSMWHTRIASHITLDEVLPVVCTWENKRVIISHVGKTAGEYEQYAKEIHALCPKAIVAYDGMRIGVPPDA